MNFFPHTSIEIPRQQSGNVAADKESLSFFWMTVESQLEEGLSGAIGYYIFSIRSGRGVLPWYVGLAEKQSFKKECFTSHKLVHYNDLLAARRGTPMMTFVSKYTPGGKLLNPTGNTHRDIRFLERLLISNCLKRNPKVSNSRDTKLLREMSVPGLMNSAQGKEFSSVSEFRYLIGT
jgi:hypothetical protein